jgi:hypothetical protein
MLLMSKGALSVAQAETCYEEKGETPVTDAPEL